MNLLPTQPFRRSSDEYLLDRFLIVDLSKQNRPILFFQDTYTRSLELVHACSIFQTHILGPWNQYTPVLFFQTHILGTWNQYTPVLFFQTHILGLWNQYTPVLFFQTHILGAWNQYTPVLFFRTHILGTQNQYTPKGIPPVRKRLRAFPYAKLCNGILCQLVS